MEAAPGTAILRGSIFVPPTAFVVAEHLGLFRSAGIDLGLAQTTSSTQQLDQLIDGAVDFVVTAMDNVIVWNQGSADTRIIAQIERTTPLSLIAKPSITSFDGLAGATLSVDAFDNGFAVVLRHLVQTRSIQDVRYVETGGVHERYSALVDGSVDAALLGPPLSEQAEKRGLTQLGRIDQLVPGFPGQAIVVKGDRVEELKPLFALLLGALRGAISWSDAVEEDTGASLLIAAGFGGDSARSAWTNRARDLWPSLDGLELLLTMRRALDILPDGVRVADLWTDELLTSHETHDVG
ncbi:ABC transporter substrate-binding protein [Microbacterium sp. LMI12-1-1.1]|uniref:ABC transporter substrate-binding protein n=1 Tax=Microbacterium sp. LMI12-1-1.1 TaxID=3135225 RepID=UPI0034389C62